MESIVVCLTGVVNRSIKYTWPSIKENIINELQKDFLVDIALFNTNVENCKVDGILLDNNDLSVVPYDFLFEYKQTFIDKEIKKIENAETEFPPYFHEHFRQNGLRLMYMESEVGKFLERKRDRYTYALITNADYFYINKLPINCLTLFNGGDYDNNIGTCHHLDCKGYTDGFYIGCIECIIKNNE